MTYHYLAASFNMVASRSFSDFTGSTRNFNNSVWVQSNHIHSKDSRSYSYGLTVSFFVHKKLSSEVPCHVGQDALLLKIFIGWSSIGSVHISLCEYVRAFNTLCKNQLKSQIKKWGTGYRRVIFLTAIDFYPRRMEDNANKFGKGPFIYL